MIGKWKLLVHEWVYLRRMTLFLRGAESVTSWRQGLQSRYEEYRSFVQGHTTATTPFSLSLLFGSLQVLPVRAVTSCQGACLFGLSLVSISISSPQFPIVVHHPIQSTSMYLFLCLSSLVLLITCAAYSARNGVVSS